MPSTSSIIIVLLIINFNPIVQNDETPPGLEPSYSFLVIVNVNDVPVCTGTLVHANWCVTAAMCMFHSGHIVDLENITVQYVETVKDEARNDNQVNGGSPNETDIWGYFPRRNADKLRYVERVFIHPKYSVWNRKSTHDIVLILLKSEMALTNNNINVNSSYPFVKLPEELILEPAVDENQLCHDLAFERDNCSTENESDNNIPPFESTAPSEENIVAAVSLITGVPLTFEDCWQKAGIDKRSQMCLECNITGRESLYHLNIGSPLICNGTLVGVHVFDVRLDDLHIVLPSFETCQNYSLEASTYVRVYTRVDAFVLWATRIMYNAQLETELRNGSFAYKISYMCLFHVLVEIFLIN